jgi:4-hydroxy-3-methylbut-2-enyl diphosphate reductase
MKQFTIPFTYRSPLINAIKEKRKQSDKMKKDFTPTLLDFGPVQFYLARHFGFCYGVENAIEIAFKTIDENPDKNIFLLSEMIHNPSVNKDLRDRGVQFLQDTYGNAIISLNTLTKDDIVLIPAFGTTVEIENKLLNIGIPIHKYNTTCPFVEKVWNRSEQIAKKNYTVVIHGKPTHEETRATFSHASAKTPSIVINDMSDAIVLSKFIIDDSNEAEFYTFFSGKISEGFNLKKDLSRIGVVNQTTMLASDTQAIADFIKQAMIKKYALTEDTIQDRFADTRDTLCYATNDNQSAVYGLLEIEADFAIVVGGYNSSNTSHLVELCEQKLITYFIDHSDRIISRENINHFNFHEKKQIDSSHFLPSKNQVRILMTSGASCPDAIVEKTIEKLASYFITEDQYQNVINHWINS